MKKKSLFFTLSILIILVAVLTLYLSGVFSGKKVQKKPEVTSKVFEIKATLVIQEASIKRDKKVIPLKPGVNLQERDLILTGKTASVELLVSGRFRIFLRSNSTLRISDLKEFFQGKESLRSYFSFSLQKGKAYFKVSKLLKKDRWLLRSPTIQVGVRGTEFVVEAAPEFSAVKVKEGRVKVRRNLDVRPELEKEISTELPANRMIKVSFQENRKIQRMIESKKYKLPQLTMEKVSSDSDFKAMEQFFSLKTGETGTILVQITNPSKSMVWLNNRPMGRGDISLYLAPGIYTIRSETLYQKFHKKLVIQDGDSPKNITVKMTDKKLQPKQPETDPVISQ